jgi:cytochrome c peroxidase
VLSDPGGGSGTFKTPTLREVAHAGLYIHGGSFAALDEVVTYYEALTTPDTRYLIPARLLKAMIPREDNRLRA